MYHTHEIRNEKLSKTIQMSLTSKDNFKLTLLAETRFEIENVHSDKTKKQLVNVNSVDILFTYLRVFISSLTANLGDGTR